MFNIKNRVVKVVLSAVSAVGLVVAGAGVGSAMAASPAAAPASNIYGCVTGSSRTLEHVFTIEKNFDNFLAKNKGKCPNGFPFTVETNQTEAPPTPTPTPTNSTPTPTDSPTITPTPTPTNTDAAKYTLTALDRSSTPNMDDPTVVGGNNDNGVVVRQEVWNPQPELRKQVTEVWSASKWRSTVNVDKGNTAVLSYPDVANTVTAGNNTPSKISTYASLNSSFSENMNNNPDTDAEATYDLWLGTSGSDQYSYELMIWMDNHGQTPAGQDTGQDIMFGGVPYRLWVADNYKLVSLVRDTNAQSGSIDLLGVIQKLIDDGHYPASIGLNMVTFGFEVCSTGGVDQVFQVNDYKLSYSLK